MLSRGKQNSNQADAGFLRFQWVFVGYMRQVYWYFTVTFCVCWLSVTCQELIGRLSIICRIIVIAADSWPTAGAERVEGRGRLGGGDLDITHLYCFKDRIHSSLVFFLLFFFSFFVPIREDLVTAAYCISNTSFQYPSFLATFSK